MDEMECVPDEQEFLHPTDNVDCKKNEDEDDRFRGPTECPAGTVNIKSIIIIYHLLSMEENFPTF